MHWCTALLELLIYQERQSINSPSNVQLQLEEVL